MGSPTFGVCLFPFQIEKGKANLDHSHPTCVTPAPFTITLHLQALAISLVSNPKGLSMSSDLSRFQALNIKIYTRTQRSRSKQHTPRFKSKSKCSHYGMYRQGAISCSATCNVRACPATGPSSSFLDETSTIQPTRWVLSY